ncbi:hypothetical protein K8R14_04375 [bacterium]|nr:hypothetical protein [bacterium]
MKQLILLCALMLGVFITPLHAQEDTTPQPTVQEEVELEETTKLSEELDIEENNSDIGFLTILFATLTPTLLIVVTYLVIKMSRD